MNEKLKTFGEKDKLPEFFGVKIERRYVNGSLDAVKVIFENDSYFVVHRGRYSDLEFAVPKPKDKKEVYFVVGKYHQLENFKSDAFDDRYKAETFIAMSGCESDLKIEVEIIEVD